VWVSHYEIPIAVKKGNGYKGGIVSNLEGEKGMGGVLRHFQGLKYNRSASAVRCGKIPGVCGGRLGDLLQESLSGAPFMSEQKDGCKAKKIFPA